MPTLLYEGRLTIEFADLYRRRLLHRPLTPPARYEGAHQSDILAYVARAAGKLKPGEPLEEDCPERVFMGIMFEEMYFSIVPDSEWQPGERLLDGIAVNCDGLGIMQTEPWHINLYGYDPEEPKTLFIEETKCTEKKLKTGEEFLEDFMWMHQGRAYCWVYGMRVVKWTILYYRGDWRGSGPVIMQYVVKFSDAECQQTWNMLRKNKDRAMEELRLQKEERAATATARS